ncbi:kinase-like domain-containing protein [Xylaria cf. heliscus]|nr:kinase-like domain-containing protein [Xylaria cf. heliscus]
MDPSSTTKLPELVRDSKLEIIPDEDNTVHIYYDRPGRRAKPRRETWKKERIIGRGGGGVVWLERRLVDGSVKGNEVPYRAVKQVTSARATPVLQICKSELEALAKFSGRKYVPWFVQSFGWYEDSGFLYIAMEYCQLGDLQQFLIQHKTLPETDTRDVISQVVQGLHYMHKEGFAHRDLKPGNILIKSHPPEKEWWVKICDMGLSKRIEEVGAETTAVKGTPGFFAPEQLGLGDADPRMADPFKTDIWCLGEMTYRMLCGKTAFPSNNDLRRYYDGTAMFPKEQLHKIGVSDPAMSFIISAMLVEPRSRLETRQAYDHEWFEMTVNTDPTTRQTRPSHHAPDPSYSKPKCDLYLGAEPSGAWSTVSLPIRPASIEAIVIPPCRAEHEHTKILPRLSPAHRVTAQGGDEGTPNDSRTLQQTPVPQENGPVVGTESHDNGQPSRRRTDESLSMAGSNPKESSSPTPVLTAVTDVPFIHVTAVESTKEDSNTERSTKPQTEETEAMQKLIKIENYFDNTLRPRSSWYLAGMPSDFKHRGHEYRWLTNVTMCDIMLEADQIESRGNEEIRTRRKALINRVNAMLDDLELANRLFESQEKEQQGHELGEGVTTSSHQQSENWAAQKGISVEEPPCDRRRLHHIKRVTISELGKEEVDEHSTSRRTSTPAEDDVVYEPPPVRNRKQKQSQFYARSNPREIIVNDDIIHNPPPSLGFRKVTPRPLNAKERSSLDNVISKARRRRLDSRIRDWLSGLDNPFPPYPNPLAEDVGFNNIL